MYVCSDGVKTAVILQDKWAESPREPGYQDNITNMVCWHGRYNLGDKHGYKEPLAFAVDMAGRYLKQQDVFRAMANGELADFRLIDNGDNGDYLVESKVGFGARQRWEQMDWKVSRDFEVVEAEDASFDLEMDVLDNCWPDELVRMCEKYGNVAILPLYLYDHSGISMSTGSFVGRAQHAEWDSGQVGYIYLDKETAMRELAMPTDEVRLAMALESRKPEWIFADSVNYEAVLKDKGFTHVKVEDLVPSAVLDSAEGQKCVDYANLNMLYKKDNRIYALDRTGEASGELRVVFSYNSGYQPLTEENWRARAEQVLEADVVEYDNYLTGEVYGYKCFEGMDEIDSCWGFNPGKEDIEDLMNLELSGWFGSEMDFEFESGDDFDIEAFFEENEFPELREKIEKDVVAFISFEQDTSQVYPFAVSGEDLLANAGGLLESIVDEIYNMHSEYDTDRIYEVIVEQVGVSRALEPKLRAEDLETGRDYTIQELAEIARAKAPMQGQVDALLDNARSRAVIGEAEMDDKGMEM